jgi:hypothetical protein
MRFTIVIACLLFPLSALAVKLEPGSLTGSFGLGPGIKLARELGGSSAYFLLDPGIEYSLDPNFSLICNLTLGIADTIPWRWRFGGRYRFTGLQGPLSPYVQAQLSNGVLFDVIGANLWVLGARLGGGADYFLTKEISVGSNLTFDLGTTLGERPSFYGTMEVMVYAAYRLQ